MPKFFVRNGNPWGTRGWLIFSPDGWSEHVTATFAEAMDYVSQQAKKRYSA